MVSLICSRRPDSAGTTPAVDRNEDGKVRGARIKGWRQAGVDNLLRGRALRSRTWMGRGTRPIARSAGAPLPRAAPSVCAHTVPAWTAARPKPSWQVSTARSGWIRTLPVPTIIAAMQRKISAASTRRERNLVGYIRFPPPIAHSAAGSPRRAQSAFRCKLDAFLGELDRLSIGVQRLDH